jgi:hypothetical protein
VARAREAAGQVTVRWAVNGTMPNGSDLQPLAGPADLRLDVEQQRALSAFTHAAWSACETREARYFAFFPLDDVGALWSLSRVTRLERGARGWVLVAWSALIDLETLDALGWPAHRLLPTAFPAPHVPVRGETYAPVRVDLAPATTSATDPLRPAMDALKASFGRGRPRVLMRVTPPVTAEAAVFALWSRLGKRRTKLAFCTWAGVESATYPAADRPFDVVVADAGEVVPSRPGRVERAISASPARRPPLAAEVLSYLEGVDFPPRETPSADPAADAAEVGDGLFSAYGEALAKDPRATFADLADELSRLDESFAPARAGLYDLLARAAAATEPGTRRARMVADFQGAAQAITARDPQAARRIAAAALRAGALAYLSARQWRALAPPLFETSDPEGDAKPDGAPWPSALRALSQAPTAAVDWAAILAVTPPGAAAAPLLRLAAARAGNEAAGRSALDRLLTLGPEAVAALVDDPGAPSRARRLALARLCKARTRPRNGVLDLVLYQRYCLWLRGRARAMPTAA